VEEESSTTVLAGLQEVIAKKGIFCASYSDSRRPLLGDAQG
jgi:hypothetical protein